MKRTHPLSFPIKMVWVAVAMVTASHLAVTTFTKHFVIAIDGHDEKQRCIPEYSVYLVKKHIDHIEKGKIYTFRAKNLTPFFDDNTLITKYAVALEGDEIVQNERGVFVNSQQYGSSYPLIDTLNIAEAELFKAYKVAKNNIFFYAPAERSFDSRYWGTANVDQVIGEAIPLW